MKQAIAFDAKRAFHNRTGLGNYSRFVLNGLAEHKDLPQRLLLMNPKPGELFAERSERLEEIRPKGIYALLSSLWRSGGMWRELRDEGVGLFHGLSGELPAGLNRQGIASVVTIHDLIFESHPHFYKPIDRQIYRKKFQAAARSATRVISVSAFTKGELVRRYGIEEAKIEVHYQSCHPAFRTPATAEEDQSLIEELPVSLPKDFVLSVGTVEERKNLLRVLKAIQARPDIPLVVVGGGGGDYAESCREYVHKQGMEKRVVWIERIRPAQLAALYRKAMIFLYPSRVEGFGIPIIEALFSGTPVITSAGGVFPEAGGPATCYVDPESPEAIQRSLVELLNDASRRGRMKEEGLKYARVHFEPDQLIDRLVELYRELLCARE